VVRLKTKVVLASLLTLIAVALLVLLVPTGEVPVLSPKGVVGAKQRDLIIYATCLMGIVIIPVFVFTAIVVWRYRATRTKSPYEPDWDRSNLIEAIWWGVPFVIVIFLSILAWKSSYDLDPFKPLESDEESLTVQVVALNWKWLFIYPEQKIATINYLQIPEKRPIQFEITGDAPMNSFWIPALGGQIFAMSGMKTVLNLISNEVGSYQGRSANLSGTGFSGMNFAVVASTQADFDRWVDLVQKSPDQLDRDKYQQLLVPSEYDPVAGYTLSDENLFDWIIMRFMMPVDQMEGH
jgi:cytochrome o ubiquinol oxidase subunit II